MSNAVIYTEQAHKLTLSAQSLEINKIQHRTYLLAFYAKSFAFSV